jgi:hypothetical protein
MKKLMGIIIVVLVGVAGYQLFSASATRLALGTALGQQMDRAEPSAPEKLRQAVIAEAGKLGVELEPSQVLIQVKDSATVSYAQRVVGKIGLTFQNKHISLTVRYQAHICGVPWAQEVRQERIKQVSVTPPAPQREAQRVLDSDN